MLILITGAEGIGKKHLGRFIVNGLNTFSHDGHSINFKQAHDGSTITEIDGVVLGEDLDDDTIFTTIQWADIFYNKVLNDYGTLCHKFDIHHDEYFDIGINAEHKLYAYDDQLLHSADVLETYRDKPEALDTVVVTGTFSSHYIQMLKDVLKDDFKAYNIIRNPSVALLLNKKGDSFFESDTKPDYTIPIDLGKYNSTTMITGALSSRPDLCETIKFEDIIKTGLVINDTKINLGEGYTPFNEYITIFEYENHFEQDLTAGNNALVNYDTLWFEPLPLGTVLTDEEELLLANIKKVVPNMFELYAGYDYEPLTYEEITSK